MKFLLCVFGNGKINEDNSWVAWRCLIKTMVTKSHQFVSFCKNFEKMNENEILFFETTQNLTLNFMEFVWNLWTVFSMLLENTRKLNYILAWCSNHNSFIFKKKILIWINPTLFTNVKSFQWDLFFYQSRLDLSLIKIYRWSNERTSQQSNVIWINIPFMFFFNEFTIKNVNVEFVNETIIRRL